ncbi:MAG: tyrosine-type recombinase/integrase, partial [Anaerolineales bacterium]
MKAKVSWTDRLHNHLTTGAAQFSRYARQGGWRTAISTKRQPQQPQHWGTQEFSKHQASSVKSISDLIELYLKSGSYLDLKATTRVSYALYLSRIEKKFGSLPISAIDERGARTAIRQWRDEVLAVRPRTADATIGVFRMLLNFALDEEYINRNPVAALGRLHTKTRRDVIWSDAQIGAFLAKAPRHLARVLLVAVWTGQRQGDLLALTWESYDGKHLRLQQRKISRGSSERRVKILVSTELKQILAEMRSEQCARLTDPGSGLPDTNLILTNGRGEPWRGGFRCAWRKAVAGAGIAGVTFHDLRGTFITLSHRAGATMREIAEASGHDEKECERIIRQHY